MRGKSLGAVLLGALSTLAAVAHAVVIQIGSGSGAPGDVVPIDVTGDGGSRARDAESHRLHARPASQRARTGRRIAP
jgi:hypothetical protein